MGDIVALIRTKSSQDSIRDSVSKILDFIDYKNKKTVNSVAIKPNLCYYWKSSTGYTTDPRVVSGVIDIVCEKYGNDIPIRIVESDATAMRTKHAFTLLDYRDLAVEQNVELFNLSNDNIIKEKVEVNGREITFEVPGSLLKTDLFINIPKLKVMRETHITCALKNIFGCIASPRKIVYHPYLEEAIVGINKILHPHLTFVDGLTALSNSPIKLNLLMGSIDPFSIDWIASQIMGYNPSKIGFLKMAMKEKLGNPTGINTYGDNIASFRSEFNKVNNLFSKWSFSIMLKLIKIYASLVGDIIPPILETN